MSIQNVLSRITELETEAVELMKKLISINSIGPKNDGPGEMEKAGFLKDYLLKCGINDIQEFNAPDKSVSGGVRPNLVARIKGKNENKTLWIIAHTDIVPAGDLSKWETDPFKAVIKDGKIYGRGSEDNQQGLVSGIIMMRAFIEKGIQPEVNIGLMLVADEETGSDFGLTYMMKNHKDLIRKNDMMIIPDAGQGDSKMIEVSEKSIIWFKFKTYGKQVHASTPDQGINAFKAASSLVVQLDSLHQLYPKTDPVFDPPISTFEPTRKEANVPNVNTIPGEDVFYLDCRILPDYKIEDVEKDVRKIADETEKKFKVKIEISTEQREQAAPSTPVNAEIVQKLEKSINTVYNVSAQPMGIGGGTVAAIVRRQGLHAAVWSTIDDMAHQPNEYCHISNMVNDAKVFALCAI